MITTPENDATSWRDLADQLTSGQLALLEHDDDNDNDPLLHRALLSSARIHARDNLAAALYADVPKPAGALKVHRWCGDDRGESRGFSGSTRVVETPQHDGDRIEVNVDGVQYPDGSVKRDIFIDRTHSDNPLTTEQALKLAAALIAAVDEVEQIGKDEAVTR